MINLYLAVVLFLIFALPGTLRRQYNYQDGKFPKGTFTPKNIILHAKPIALALIPVSVLLILIPITALPEIGIKIPKYWVHILLVITTVPTVALISLMYNIKKLVGKYRIPYAWITGSALAFTTTVASVFTDGEISSITGLDASTFPQAQKSLFFLILLIVWCLVILWSSLALYLITAIRLMAVGHKDKRSIYFSALMKKQEAKKQNIRAFNLIGIMIGLAFITILGPISLNSVTKSETFTRLERSLIFVSSFHIPPETCGIANQAEEVKITTIRYQYAVIGTPDKKAGYKFTVTRCSLQTESPQTPSTQKPG